MKLTKDGTPMRLSIDPPFNQFIAYHIVKNFESFKIIPRAILYMLIQQMNSPLLLSQHANNPSFVNTNIVLPMTIHLTYLLVAKKALKLS
eukprot:c17226_g1_i1 orf=3262-3531(-)